MRKHPVQFGEPPACVTDPVAFQRVRHDFISALHLQATAANELVQALESRVNHNVTLLAEAGMVNVMANTTGLMPTKLGNIMVCAIEFTKNTSSVAIRHRLGIICSWKLLRRSRPSVAISTWGAC